MTDDDKQKQKLPEPRDITLPDRDFQPRKAEQERACDMPRASLSTIRASFFRPFNVRREERNWKGTIL